MGLPNVNVTAADGALGLASEQAAGIFALVARGSGTLGIDQCAVVVDPDGLDALLGTDGNLGSYCKKALLAGARQIVAVRSAAESAGAVSDVTTEKPAAILAPERGVATGTGAIIATGTPIQEGEIELEIVDSGEPGVATFKYRLVPLGGAAPAWSDPLTTGAAVALAGLGVTLNFAAGAEPTSFVAGDAWKIMLLPDGGLVDLSVTGTPTSNRSVEVLCTKLGGLNEAEVVIITNGETSAPRVVQESMALDELTLVFTAEAGKPFVMISGDRYLFATTAGLASVGSLSAAIQALAASPYAGLVEWISVGEPTDDAAWVALAALVETAFAEHHRYVHLVCEAPGPDEGETTDDWVERLLDLGAGVSHVRLSVVAGRAEVTDPLTGESGDCNALPIYCGRLAQVAVQRSVGAPIDGALALATDLSPADLNDGHIEQLDATGHFITVRRIEGLGGIYVTNGRMMVSSTSDYRWVEWRRVMDKACREVRLAGLRSMHLEGDEPGLKALLADLQQPLNRMIAAGEISAGSCSLPPGQDVIGTGTVKVKVSIQPRPAMRFIDLEVGFSNPYRGSAV